MLGAFDGSWILLILPSPRPALRHWTPIPPPHRHGLVGRAAGIRVRVGNVAGFGRSLDRAVARSTARGASVR